jgi:hypothetical protein
LVAHTSVFAEKYSRIFLLDKKSSIFHTTSAIAVVTRIIITIFKGVESTPRTISIKITASITDEMLSTEERAIRVIIGSWSFSGKNAQLRANPGINRTSVSPRSIRKKFNNVPIISTNRPPALLRLVLLLFVFIVNVVSFYFFQSRWVSYK